MQIPDHDPFTEFADAKFSNGPGQFYVEGYYDEKYE